MGFTVLLVQLDWHDRTFYGGSLQAAGFRIIATDTAEQAWSLSMSADVVVTGLVLRSRMTGFHLITRLRQHPSTAKLPIIMLSGYHEPLHRARAAAAGCDVFLTKPCPPETLVQRIREVIGKQGTRSDA